MLDEVGEGEMVENKLVIPDEMMQYLNEVIIVFIITIVTISSVSIELSKNITRPFI